MTVYHYPVQSHADFITALPDMVRFLINDHGVLVGPNWSLIEAYDGTTRETPGLPHDMDSFSAGFGWRTGALGLGDWIVLRSDVGVAGTQMEIYLEYDSATNLKVALIPLNNWVTSATLITPPTPELVIAKAVGAGAILNPEGASFVSVTAFSTLAKYTIVADEAMMAILIDNTTNSYWTYVGEIIPARFSGTPADDSPYVIMDAPAQVSTSMASVWNRLSPLDDVTFLTQGMASEFNTASGYVLATLMDVNPLGLWLVLPLGMYFHDTSHRHFAGILKNVASCSVDKGAIGTIGSLAWMYRNNGTTGRGLCFAWDGVTIV